MREDAIPHLYALEDTIKNFRYTHPSEIENAVGALTASHTAYKYGKDQKLYNRVRTARDVGVGLGFGVAGYGAAVGVGLMSGGVGAVPALPITSGVAAMAGEASIRAMHGNEESEDWNRDMDEPGEIGSLFVSGGIAAGTAGLGNKILPIVSKIPGVNTLASQAIRYTTEALLEGTGNVAAGKIQSEMTKNESSAHEYTPQQAMLDFGIGAGFSVGSNVAGDVLGSLKMGKQQVEATPLPTVGKAPITESPVNPGINNKQPATLKQSLIGLPTPARKEMLRQHALTDFNPDATRMPTPDEYSFKTDRFTGKPVDPLEAEIASIRYNEHKNAFTSAEIAKIKLREEKIKADELALRQQEKEYLAAKKSEENQAKLKAREAAIADKKAALERRKIIEDSNKALSEGEKIMAKEELKKELEKPFNPDITESPKIEEYLKDIEYDENYRPINKVLYEAQNIRYEQHLKQHKVHKKASRASVRKTELPDSPDPLVKPRGISDEESRLVAETAVTPPDESLMGLPTEVLERAKMISEAEYVNAKTADDLEYESEILRAKEEIKTAKVEEKPKAQKKLADLEAQRPVRERKSADKAASKKKKSEPIDNELKRRKAEDITKRLDKEAKQHPYYNNNPIHNTIHNLRPDGTSQKIINLRKARTLGENAGSAEAGELQMVENMLNPIDNLGKITNEEFTNIADQIINSADPADAFHKMNKNLFTLQYAIDNAKSTAAKNRAITEFLKVESVYKMLTNGFTHSIIVDGSADVYLSPTKTQNLKDYLIDRFQGVLKVEDNVGSTIRVSLENYDPNFKAKVNIDRVALMMSKADARDQSLINMLREEGDIDSTELSRYMDMKRGVVDADTYNKVTQEVFGFDAETGVIGNKGYKGDVSAC